MVPAVVCLTSSRESSGCYNFLPERRVSPSITAAYGSNTNPHRKTPSLKTLRVDENIWLPEPSSLVSRHFLEKSKASSPLALGNLPVTLEPSGAYRRRYSPLCLSFSSALSEFLASWTKYGVPSSASSSQKDFSRITTLSSKGT